MAKINWTLQTFNLDELTDYYKNPRSLTEKEFKQLKTSLDKFGMIDKPIVNADPVHTVIGGHQRKHVLEATGVKEIECWIPDRELSDKEVEELNIRLNKNTGSWDFDTLANEFELDDLLEWGFERNELDLDLWVDDPPEDVEPQLDKAEELREKWGVETGQLWQLGDHRLVCGDCTDKAVVEKVMGGEKADMVMTDPPYALFGNSTGVSGIADDKMVRPFFRDIAKMSMEFTNPFSHVYVCCDWHSAFVIQDVMQTAGLTAKNLCIWDKGDGGIGANYQICYEMIWFFSNSPKAHGTLARKTTGERTVNGVPNIWRFPRSPADRHHNAEKPVELFSVPISHGCKEGEIVIDFFLGGGTTLIACERLGRKCRSVEISPAYVAVAIQRWVDVTGGEPVMLSN